jgi:hypothetical protein
MTMTIVERISSSLTGGRDSLRPIESQMGRPLPDDYVAFLVTHNGGRPKPSDFTFRTKSGESTDSSIQCFFGWCDDANYGLLQNLSVYEDRIVTEFIPIACDALGNLLLLSLRPSDYGSVWFWDHELESEDHPTMDNMDMVADSFTEFVDNLQ